MKILHNAVLKSILLLLLGWLGTSTLYAQPGESMYGDRVKVDVKMKYVYSFEEALKEAKQQKKYIFFNSFADWAMPCHAMNRYVFSNQAFCDYMNKTFVNLFIDVTKTEEGKALAEKYNIKRFAQYLILDSNGDIVQRIVGGGTIPQFKQWVQMALNPKLSLAATEKKYNSGKYSRKELYNYLNALNVAGETKKFKTLSDKYLKVLPEKEYAKKENWEMYKSVARDVDSTYFNYLIDHKQDFLKNSGDSAVNTFIDWVFCSVLFDYATNSRTYDAQRLLTVYLKMQKAELPESSISPVVYSVARLRHEKKYAELIECLKKNRKLLDNGLIAIDLSLDIPDLTKEEKKLIGNYLVEESKAEQGRARNMLDALAQKLLSTKEEGILFNTATFADAKKKAKEGKKLIFMDCFTTWCGPCKILASQVFPQKKMGDYVNAHFISIKMDMEKGEGTELAKTYAIKAYPTMLVLDADGKELTRLVGAWGADKILDKLQEVVNKQN